MGNVGWGIKICTLYIDLEPGYLSIAHALWRFACDIRDLQVTPSGAEYIVYRGSVLKDHQPKWHMAN